MSLLKRLAIPALVAASLVLVMFLAQPFRSSRLTEPHAASLDVSTNPPPIAPAVSSPPLPVPIVPAARLASSAAALEEIRRVLPSITEPVANWKEFRPAAITIAPYPDLPLEFTATTIREEHGRTVWTGRNAVEGAFLVSAATENEWHATLVIPGASLFDVFISGNSVTLTEKNYDVDGCVEPEAASEGGAIADTPAAQVASAPSMAAGDVNVVDVLFFHDEATLALVEGHVSTIITRTISYLEVSNAALQNSGVNNLRWRFVGLYQVPPYTATARLHDDLAMMRGNGEVARFVADKVLRHGADQAVLYVGGAGMNNGTATRVPNPGDPNSDASAVARWNTTPFLLAHELAHNFGCWHDRQTDSVRDGNGRYYYGFRFYDNASVLTGTIMAYSDNTLPYFSNPAVSYQGQALGVAESEPKAAHDARWLTEMAATMANRRQEVILPTITAHPQSLTIVRGQQLDLAVTASGTNLQYQWRKDGVPIAGAVDSKFTRASAADTDAGVYTALVFNGASEVVSAAATVAIAASAPAPSGAGAAGGGGAVSIGFLLVLALLTVVRFAAPQRTQ